MRLELHVLRPLILGVLLAALLAQAPSAQAAPGGCKGKVRFVFTDSSGRVNFVLGNLVGTCTCTRALNGLAPYFGPFHPQANEKEMFTTALAAATTGATVNVFMDDQTEPWTGSGACYAYFLAIDNT